MHYLRSKIFDAFFVPCLALVLTGLASVAHTGKQKKLHGSGVKMTLVIPNESLAICYNFSEHFKTPVQNFWRELKLRSQRLRRYK